MLRPKFTERRGSYIGYGAIIGAVASIAGSAISGATKGGGGANMGEYSSRLNEAANQYILPFLDPSKWALDIPGMAGQAIGFGLAEAPAINQANMGELQGLLTRAMPGWQNMFNQMQDTWGQMRTNVSSMLSGVLPQDVQDRIRRNAAFTSLMGGSAGAGTGTTGAITARDLGLTSLDLTEKGQALGSNLLAGGTNLLSFARNYLMPQPVNPLSLLPLSDLISGTEWSKEAVFKANEAAYTAKANAAAAAVGAPSQPFAGMGGDIAGILGALTKQNPQTGKSLLGGLFGGGGGGGGGFSAPSSGFSGLSSSDMSSVIGGGFSSGGLEAADFQALGLL